MASLLEKRFLYGWESYADPSLEPPEAEYRFHPTRKWRFDYAWPQYMVAIDIQGSTFARGRHSRGAGQQNDHEKHNAAVMLGWRILYLDTVACQRKNLRFTIPPISDFLLKLSSSA